MANTFHSLIISFKSTFLFQDTLIYVKKAKRPLWMGVFAICRDGNAERVEWSYFYYPYAWNGFS